MSPVSPLFHPHHSLCCNHTGFFSPCNTPYSLPLNAQASSCPKVHTFGGFHQVAALFGFNSNVTSFSEAVPDQPHTTPHPHTSPPPTPASCIMLISTRDDIALRRHLHLSPQEEHNCPLIGRGQGCCQTSYHAQTDPTTNDYLAPNATAEKPGPVTICSFSAALIGAGIDGLGAGVPY